MNVKFLIFLTCLSFSKKGYLSFLFLVNALHLHNGLNESPKFHVLQI